jgi:transcriptional regulator with XRE-family HTH domain
MSGSSTRQFGTLLRLIRKRAGLSQQQFSEHVAVSTSRVSKWEKGVSKPPQDPQFYNRLRTVPGFTESDITRLMEARKDIQAEASEIVKEEARTEHGNEPRMKPWFIARRPSPDWPITKISNEFPLIPEDEDFDIITEFLQEDDRLRLLDPKKGADSEQNGLKENPLPIHYQHTMPEHGSHIVDEGKWQRAPKIGVVFQNSDAKLLFDALGNPDHEYRLAAENAMRGFANDVKNAKVASLSQVSRELGIPHKNLSEWVAKGLIPYEYRDKNALYLSKEVVQEVDRDNEEAKEMGIQTARLLRERHDKYFPPAPNS